MIYGSESNMLQLKEQLQLRLQFITSTLDVKSVWVIYFSGKSLFNVSAEGFII